MNLHTNDAIRADTEYRREQLSRSWPKRRSRHKKRKKKLMKQPASDAIVVNPLGTVMCGRDKVEASVRALLVGGPLQGATAHYRITDITSLPPHVVVGHKNAWSDPQHAEVRTPPQMNAICVFANRAGAWWVLRRQSTTVGG